MSVTLTVPLRVAALLVATGVLDDVKHDVTERVKLTLTVCVARLTIGICEADPVIVTLRERVPLAQ